MFVVMYYGNCRMNLRLTTDSKQFQPTDNDTDLQHIAMTALQGLDIEPDDNNLIENKVNSTFCQQACIFLQCLLPS